MSAAPSLRFLIASLSDLDRGVRFEAVSKAGHIYQQTTRQGKVRWVVDIRPVARIYSVPGHGPLETKENAQRVLNHIQGELVRGRPLEAILAIYLPIHAKPLMVAEALKRWLEVKRDQVRAGERSPRYLTELERYSSQSGHFGWWWDRSIYEVDYGSLEDWTRWLCEREIGPKTRRNVLGAFRSFLGWLRRRGELKALPEMPTIKVPEYGPTIIDARTQDLILEAIPLQRRGAFLAMARLGLRPSEVRALDVQDYRDEWLTIHRAVKGPNSNAPIGGTKTGQVRRLPVDEELAGWIESHVSTEARLKGATPLFPNPTARNRSRRWIWNALSEEWKRACGSVGVRVGLYEGTRHAFATDAMRRGVQERHVQAFLGHADPRSTRRYARLADQALVTVLRPRSER